MYIITDEDNSESTQNSSGFLKIELSLNGEEDTYQIDKSLEEIHQAIENGIMPIIHEFGMEDCSHYYRLTNVEYDGGLIFEKVGVQLEFGKASEYSVTVPRLETIFIQADGTIHRYAQPLMIGDVEELTLSIEEKATMEQVNEAIAAEMVGTQPKITGTAGQFVVIGEDGNVTTKTITNAEEASF